RLSHFLPSPGGVETSEARSLGRLASSVARCGTGWGDGLSTRALFKGRDCHPTPPLSGRCFASPGRVDPPPPGEGKVSPSFFRAHLFDFSIAWKIIGALAIGGVHHDALAVLERGLADERAQGRLVVD